MFFFISLLIYVVTLLLWYLVLLAPEHRSCIAGEVGAVAVAGRRAFGIGPALKNLVSTKLVLHLDRCIERTGYIELGLVAVIGLFVVHLRALNATECGEVKAASLAPTLKRVHASQCNPLRNADALLVVSLVVWELLDSLGSTGNASCFERSFNSCLVVSLCLISIASLGLVLSDEELNLSLCDEIDGHVVAGHRTAPVA